MPVTRASSVRADRPTGGAWATLLLLGTILLAGGFGVGCGGSEDLATATEKPWTSLIDEDRAFTDLKNYVAKGPASHARGGADRINAGRAFIKERLKDVGITKFKHDDWAQRITVESSPRTVVMENIVGILPGKRTEAIAIGCHYDIKILPNFQGANDGASGVALTIELARQLVEKAKKDGPPEFSYYFCFFDGEEAFVDWNEVGEDGHPDNTYGSRRMASRSKEYPIKTLVLLDLVGDKDLQLTEDTSSTAELMEMFIAESKEIFGVNKFGNRRAILDDHIPFIDRGVPAIDLIDFNYGPNNSWWHSSKDVVENCSPRSLALVGTLVLTTLPKLERWLKVRLAK